MLKGVDTSSYQGNVDFAALKTQADFVITKVTENNNYVNPYFARTKSEARRVGLLLGYYHFARPAATSPQVQADYFIDSIGPMNHGEILVLDYEIDFPGDTDAWCFGFLSRCEERTGVKPLIYLNQSLANMYPWARTIAGGFGLWLAQYDSSPTGINHTPWPTVAMKQYTSSGTIAGVAGNADLDSFFGDADAFKAYGYKGTSSPTTPNDGIVQTQGLPAHHEPNLSSTWDWYYDNQEHITLLSKTVGELVADGPYAPSRYWYQTDKGWVSDAYVLTAATPPAIPDFVPPVPTPTPVITTGTVTETKVVPFKSTTVEDNTLPVGTAKTTQAGVDGVETIIYSVAYSDGVETGRTVTSDTVTTQPVDEIIATGTLEPTPPSPQPTPDPEPLPIPTPPQPPVSENPTITELKALIHWCLQEIEKLFHKNPKN